MERKNSIDFLRIISAVAVVLIHIVSAPVSKSSGDMEYALWRNLQLTHVLMNWAVPVFFMITGYCMMKKESLTYRYCFAHIRKYVCVLFTVGLSYALMAEIFEHGTFNLTILGQAVLNVLRGDLWAHMWFMYSIIGVYLVLPVIHRFMTREERDARILTALLFLLCILLPAFEGILPIGIKLPFDGYLFYVCMGGLLARQKLGKKWIHAIYLAGVLGLGWILLGWHRWGFGYLHPAVCAMAVSIFLLVSKMNIRPGKLLLGLSGCTWGVYLIHPFFINVAIKVIGIDLLSSGTYMKLLALLVAVLALSFVGTWVLRKIPYVKKLF